MIMEFRKYRSEKEEHSSYLKTVVQHINIGIITYTSDGKVDIYNSAVKRLLSIRNLRYISDLAEAVHTGRAHTALRLCH